MIEAVSKLFVLEQLHKLHVAFPSHSGMKNNPEGTAKEYCEALQGLSEDALRAAVKIWIANEKFFPKIAELRNVAWDWTRRNRPEDTPGAESKDPMWCPRCQSRLDWLQRWRPRIDPQTQAPIAQQNADGVVFILLERYERLLCKCAAPCVFAPEPEQEQPWMRRDRVTHLFGAPRMRAGGSRIVFAPPLSDERLETLRQELARPEAEAAAEGGAR